MFFGFSHVFVLSERFQQKKTKIQLKDEGCFFETSLNNFGPETKWLNQKETKSSNCTKRVFFGRQLTRRLVNRSTVILIDRESAESLPQKNWSTARGLSTTYLVTAQRLVDIFFLSKTKPN